LFFFRRYGFVVYLFFADAAPDLPLATCFCNCYGLDCRLVCFVVAEFDCGIISDYDLMLMSFVVDSCVPVVEFILIFISHVVLFVLFCVLMVEFIRLCSCEVDCSQPLHDGSSAIQKNVERKERPK
jgi:hypothetical protein